MLRFFVRRLAFLYQQGPRHFRPLPNLWIATPPLGGPTCCLGHRYRPGHIAISLPSTYLGNRFPGVRSTLYLSATHASARLDSVGSWPDLRLVLCVFSINCILKASVVILLHQMRTVKDDPSNRLIPE